MTLNALHTIGYDGGSIGDFLATLGAVGIGLLIDVRDVPISRKTGFSTSALSGWLASLGHPKPGPIAARKGRYDDFRCNFAAHLRSEVSQTAALPPQSGSSVG